MIKVEVVFDGDELEVNGQLLEIIGRDGGILYCIVNRDVEFDYIEQAIAYCLEKSK